MVPIEADRLADMPATTILDARLITLRGGAGPRRGAAMLDLGVVERGHVVVEDGTIVAVGPGDPPDLRGEVLHAGGRAVMPALVDCHTHLCWTGERYDERSRILSGVPYLEILASGGGIMRTVRAVREADERTLVADLRRRLAETARLGSGTIEVKSGYGLTVHDEFRMLAAIEAASRHAPRLVVPTFLGLHARDPQAPGQLEAMVQEALPALAARHPGMAVDAYCEEGAFSVAECRRFLEAARALGLPLRLHADQFNALGGTSLAVELGARSVDHLEATTPGELARLAESRTIGVVLPCCGFTLDGRYAPARALLDAGGALAIASNANPGSAPSPSLAFSLALAVRFMGVRPEEALVAGTWNAACVLGVESRAGSLEPGKRADLLMLHSPDPRSLTLEYAGAGPAMVMLGGVVQ